MNQQNSFGAIIREQDPRDYPLGAFTPETFPEKYFTDISKFPVENQRKIPACGSHAGSFVKNVQDGVRLSPAYLWKEIKLVDGHPIESGTDMLSIFRVLNKTGVCKYDLMPNDTTVTPEEYTKYNVNMEQQADAASHKIGTYAFEFYPSMDSMKKAIFKHKAVLCLIRIGEEFWKPSWSATQPLRPPKNPISGHFVTLYGYDKDYIYFRNEWGSEYGEQGNGRFGVNYLPYVVEIGTAVDDNSGRFKKNLQYGSMGIDVWSLQRFLVSKGFGSYTPTGFFGPKTVASVKAFQARYGIQQTGTVGPITRGKLNILYD